MPHVHDTFYVLEDGSKADPNDVAPDDSGALRHKNGTAVAMRGSVPRTSGVGPVTTKAAPAAKDREMKPADDGKGYRTRGR